jgi:hypothetical protein
MEDSLKEDRFELLKLDELDFIASSKRCKGCKHLICFHVTVEPPIGPTMTLKCLIPDCKCNGD